MNHGVVAGDIRPGQFSLLGVGLIFLISVAFDILGVKLDFVNLYKTLGAGVKFGRVRFFSGEAETRAVLVGG